MTFPWRPRRNYVRASPFLLNCGEDLLIVERSRPWLSLKKNLRIYSRQRRLRPNPRVRAGRIVNPPPRRKIERDVREKWRAASRLSRLYVTPTRPIEYPASHAASVALRGRSNLIMLRRFVAFQSDVLRDQRLSYASSRVRLECSTISIIDRCSLNRVRRHSIGARRPNGDNGQHEPLRCWQSLASGRS